MALYAYQAYTKDGKKITGTVDATSVTAVREQLSRSGLYPISVTTAAAEEMSLIQRLGHFFHRRVKTKEKILLTKQLSVLLRSGIPLLEAFELLIDQFEGRLRVMLISIKDRLREGSSLAEALAQYPDVFDNVYVQLVRAGEATGRLEIILERLTSYMERREEISSRVRSAMTYPLIQLGLVLLVLVGLMTFVVPSLADQFRRSKKELPWSTELLMNISDFIRSYYLLVVIAILGLVLLFRWWKSTPSGARTYDKIKLKIPIVRFFARMGAVAQFSRTLGMLIESNVNFAEALDIVCNIIDNRILAQSLMQARENIIKQGRIAEYLRETGVFPPVAIYLIKTGEESGKLDTMLLTVAQNYETELKEYADGLSDALGPIMMIVMGITVGFIVISIAQPMMQQAQLVEI